MSVLGNAARGAVGEGGRGWEGGEKMGGGGGGRLMSRGNSLCWLSVNDYGKECRGAQYSQTRTAVVWR